jgi:hypothetical protein
VRFDPEDGILVGSGCRRLERLLDR